MTSPATRITDRGPRDSAESQSKADKRYGYIVTAVDGDLSVLPSNLRVGTILLEKRGRGAYTSWDFINFDTGATASAAGRKIGVGYAVNGRIEWVGGTPREAIPCPASHHFPKASGCRAATVTCHLSADHAGAHEAIKGTTAYTWREDTGQ